MPRRTHNGLRHSWRDRLSLLLLSTLVAATFLMGGGARGDIVSLAVLRPFAVLCLAYGLYGLTGEQWRAQRAPLTLVALICLLIAVHLVPLPPALWQGLPGREFVAHADEVAGLGDVWRPIALVPYRGWNALWSMAVPAGAMILAARIPPDDHWLVVRLVAALAMTSALLGIAQAVSGYDPALFPYRITNSDSPVGLFANRNHQAALMCAALPLLALVGMRAQGASRATVQFVCAGTAIVMLFVLLATGSRGGLVFLAVALAGTGFILAKAGYLRDFAATRRSWLIPLAATVALIGIIALAVLFARAGAIERLAGSDAVEELRPDVWRVTAEALPGYLPIGAGIGSFVEVFAMVEPADMLSLAYWNHAHNDVLEWILDGGVPAALLIVAALILWVSRARSIGRRLPRAEPNTLLAAAGALVVFILGVWSLVDYPLRVPSLAVMASLAAIWMNGTGAARGQSGQSVNRAPR